MKHPLIEMFGEDTSQQVELNLNNRNVPETYSVRAAAHYICLFPWEVDSLIGALMRLRERARARGIKGA